MKKLSIAVIWHMHQPLYRDRLTGVCTMPWVRLHAVKDYLDMVSILDGFPLVRQTFNLVPSLLEQLQDYADGKRDRAFEVSLKPAASLTHKDRLFLFERFFDLSENQLALFPRFARLAEIRKNLLDQFSPIEAVREIPESLWTDLMVLFNLAWLDPFWIEEDPELSRLSEKANRNEPLSHSDQLLVLEKQQELIKRIIPTYRRMAESGQIELTTSPFYHPILPLLCDIEVAREAIPDLPLPSGRFAHPQDATRQVRRGLDFFEQTFGFRPKGFWPPEQSVSLEAIEILLDEGIEWVVSDEGILANSLGTGLEREPWGALKKPELLYRPYWIERGGERLAAVFRDTALSDLIGFSYSRLNGALAADDLVRRLKESAERLPSEGDHLVTIALDGENCWEYYPRDGRDFLEALYEAVSREPSLEMTTVSRFLAAHPPEQTLPRLHPGSWISSNFTTWIGDPVKNLAWEYLRKTREDLDGWAGSLRPREWEQAWEEIAIAEGSDWFWWFGEGNSSGQDESFDLQFRLHLQNVYRLGKRPVPEALLQPVAPPKRLLVPKLAIRPRLDGHTLEGWTGAGIFDPAWMKGTMHQSLRLIQKLRYGFDALFLYLRLEFTPFFARDPEDEVAIYFCYPGQTRLNSPVNFRAGMTEMGIIRDFKFAHEVRIGWNPLEAVLSSAGEYHTWIQQENRLKVAYREALEVAVPFDELAVPPSQEMRFALVLARQGTIVEVVPVNETLKLFSPFDLEEVKIL